MPALFAILFFYLSHIIVTPTVLITLFIVQENDGVASLGLAQQGTIHYVNFCHTVVYCLTRSDPVRVRRNKVILWLTTFELIVF